MAVLTSKIADKLIEEQGENIVIPKQAKHRIGNKTKSPLIFIEVQTGDYFGEDDIKRYEDDYGRC